MSLILEWDPDKAAANLGKHGVSFEEAASAFADPLSLTILDPEFAEGTNLVVLEPDVAQRFGTSEEVNQALRKLLADETQAKPGRE